jgi:hypothetical protein
MDTPPRPKPGRLGTVHGMLTGLLVINVLALVAAALVKVNGSIVTFFTVDPEVVYGPQPGLSQQANKQLAVDTVDVFVRDPSGLQTVLGLLAQGLAVWLVTIPMLLYARRLVRRVLATHAFTAETVNGLRRLGYLVLIGGVVAELVRSVALMVLRDTALRTGFDSWFLEWRIDFWWLLLGLVILAFAQVVEHGRALRAELDEVI